jgi:iron(III) transport system permease protein
LLPGISLVYLFGNQGLLKEWLPGGSIYGLTGIVLGEAFYTFPHALMILLTALSVGDARLYEAAGTLGAGRVRQFLTITLPGSRYGVVSAALLVFTPPSPTSVCPKSLAAPSRCWRWRRTSR